MEPLSISRDGRVSTHLLLTATQNYTGFQLPGGVCWPCAHREVLSQANVVACTRGFPKGPKRCGGAAGRWADSPHPLSLILSNPILQQILCTCSSCIPTISGGGIVSLIELWYVFCSESDQKDFSPICYTGIYSSWSWSMSLNEIRMSLHTVAI